ncbi:MAG: cytochrome c oxidase subunit II, partial [Halobacteria archaeon]|nr:cytochrome c oxidase subunit II [Halobacteria archaeon]
LRVKTDAIPGQTTTTWFVANETGTYQAQCFELCGTGHSFMDAQVVVMEQEEFEEWYTNSSTQNNATVSTP